MFSVIRTHSQLFSYSQLYSWENDGYSINEDGVTVEVEASDTANVEVSDHVIDTKLSSLPSTGGIGTTIFTIGGCVIMIVAAGLYFSTRKKEEN